MHNSKTFTVLFICMMHYSVPNQWKEFRDMLLRSMALLFAVCCLLFAGPGEVWPFEGKTVGSYPQISHLWGWNSRRFTSNLSLFICLPRRPRSECLQLCFFFYTKRAVLLPRIFLNVFQHTSVFLSLSQRCFFTHGI